MSELEQLFDHLLLNSSLSNLPRTPDSDDGRQVFVQAAHDLTERPSTVSFGTFRRVAAPPRILKFEEMHQFLVKTAEGSRLKDRLRFPRLLADTGHNSPEPPFVEGCSRQPAKLAMKVVKLVRVWQLIAAADAIREETEQFKLLLGRELRGGHLLLVAFPLASLPRFPTRTSTRQNWLFVTRRCRRASYFRFNRENSSE